MKKLQIILLVLFTLISVKAQEIIIMDSDVAINSVGFIDNSKRLASGIRQGGKDITASGILKIPVVFLRFADDNNVTAHWPVVNQIPDWAQSFVDAQIPDNGIYSTNNFSKFYDLSSSGDGNGTMGNFQVIGDVYYINLPYNRSHYSTDAAVTTAVLDILDNPSLPYNVDFRKYDNWEFKVGGEYYEHDYRPFNPKTGTSADGKLDFMLIYYKGRSARLAANVGGRADLGISVPITKDGISILVGAIGFKAEIYGLEHTRWVSAHEIGHHQFGAIYLNTGSHFNGRNDNYGNLQSFGLMTTSSGHQFSAYERYRLGWLDPIYIMTNSSSIVVNETHKSTSDNAVIIPVRYDGSARMIEYFLLENYHTTYAYPDANPFLTKNLFNHVFTKGIIVYHVVEEDFDWPTLSKIDIESAEGLFTWNVIQGASTPSDRLDDLIAPVNTNVLTGFDDRERITATAGTITYNDYLALTPGSSTLLEDKKKRRYNSDDYLGDQEDLFSLEYNKVFNCYSNPSSNRVGVSTVYKGFEILSYNNSTHQYTLKVGVNSYGITEMSPAKPQNLKVTCNASSNPLLTWDSNIEPDKDAYVIERTEGNGIDYPFWENIATVTTTSYIDYDVAINPVFEDEVSYRIKALDTQGKLSIPSSIATIGDAVLHKLFAESNVFYNFEIDAYPNPFNPSTTIRYQIPEDGMVTLKVYDILGREIKTLVNNFKTKGRYEVTFDASSLASGLYIYEITSGSYKASKKMTLIK